MTVKTFIQRYPVFVQGRHPKNKTVRGAVLIREVEIGVPVLAGADAPVAATIRTLVDLMGRKTVVTSEFRHCDGAFYAMSQLQPHDLAEAFANPFSSWGHRRKLTYDVQGKARNQQCWPKDIVEQFDKPDERHPSGELCLRESGMVIVEPGQEDVFRDQQAQAEALQGHFVMIDGRLWERSPEPAYKLTASERKVAIDTHDTTQAWWGKVGRCAGDARFSLLDRANVVAVFSDYYGGTDSGWPEVDISMPEAFETDFAALNFADFARCIAYNFNGERHGRIGDNVALLRSLVMDRPTEDIDFDGLERVVIQILDDNRRFGIFRDVEPSALRQHMQLWDSRPVELKQLRTQTATP
jgi:hypothetical protein